MTLKETIKTLVVVALLLAALVLLVGLQTGCTVCPPCPECPTVAPTATVAATETPEPWSWPYEWDARADRLNIRVGWEGNMELRYYPIAVWITEDGRWQDDMGNWLVPSWARGYLTPEFTEAGGATHMFGRCLDMDGNVLPTKYFTFSWPDGSEDKQPEGSGWMNSFASARYDPAVTSGPYCLAARNGVPVCGGGQPYGGPHVSIFVVWKARW